MTTVSRVRVLVMLLLLTVITTGPAIAQNPSPDKPYQQWTLKEVEKLLTDSPWALSQDKGVVLVNDPANANNMIQAPQEMVVIRLRSALPVRQALARLRQLKAKYDKMSDSEKKAFDEKTKVLMDCPACTDNYVVSVAPGPGDKGVPTILLTMTDAEVKLNVQLMNDRGEKRELAHFERPKHPTDEAVFFFARFNDKGEPLITPNSRKLVIHFEPKIFGLHAVTLTKFEFDVSRLLIKGEVAF